MTKEEMKEYQKIKQSEYRTIDKLLRLDCEKRRNKYRFIKKYENFVLLERIGIGYKECFSHGEVKQLEVV